MKLKLFATYRDIANAKVVDVPIEDTPSMTVRELLHGLINMFPAFQDELFTEDEQLKPYIHIFVSGRNIIHLDGLSTIISPDNEIALIPPVGGG